MGAGRGTKEQVSTGGGTVQRRGLKGKKKASAFEPAKTPRKKKKVGRKKGTAGPQGGWGGEVGNQKSDNEPLSTSRRRTLGGWWGDCLRVVQVIDQQNPVDENSRVMSKNRGFGTREKKRNKKKQNPCWGKKEDKYKTPMAVRGGDPERGKREGRRHGGATKPKGQQNLGREEGYTLQNIKIERIKDPLVRGCRDWSIKRGRERIVNARWRGKRAEKKQQRGGRKNPQTTNLVEQERDHFNDHAK